LKPESGNVDDIPFLSCGKQNSGKVDGFFFRQSESDRVKFRRLLGRAFNGNYPLASNILVDRQTLY
jgi:hypothetical protein